MGWKQFELNNAYTQEQNQYTMPKSAPAPIVQDAIELMHGDTEGRIQGDKVNASIKTGNIEKAADHIVKELLKLESFPKDNNIDYDKLDGDSLDKLKNHYMEVDLRGKNSSQSGEEQSSSEKQ